MAMRLVFKVVGFARCARIRAHWRRPQISQMLAPPRSASPRILCPHSQPWSMRPHFRSQQMTPSSGLVLAFTHPAFPSRAVSLSTFSLFPCSCFLEHLLCSTLPGLLVRLPLVSVFSDLPFRSLRQ